MAAHLNLQLTQSPLQVCSVLSCGQLFVEVQLCIQQLLLCLHIKITCVYNNSTLSDLNCQMNVQTSSNNSNRTPPPTHTVNTWMLSELHATHVYDRLTSVLVLGWAALPVVWETLLLLISFFSWEIFSVSSFKVFIMFARSSGFIPRFFSRRFINT